MVRQNMYIVNALNQRFLHYFILELGDKDWINEKYLFNTLRICHVTQGKADWNIADKIYTIQTGDIVILNNTVPRGFRKVYPPERLLVDVYEFSPAILSSSLECLKTFYLNRGFTISAPDSDKITNELLELKDEIFNSRPMRSDMILTHLMSALIRASRILSVDEHSGVSENDFLPSVPYLIYDTTAYIWNNLSKPLDAETLAKRINLSRGYFCEAFKKYSGVTPAVYVKKCRVMRVMQLMQTNNNTVMKAALESGFNSISSFYKAFRDITGTTPKEYFTSNSLDFSAQ